jgi:hypothetical protein
MIVQHEGVIIRNSNNYNKCSRGDIINVTKAVARKSTLQIIKKSQSGKFIPLDKETGEPHQCQ